MATRLIIFFLVNFGALAIGGLFTPSGVSSDWYAELNKAPWTPPGWVFGSAWTLIMICFSIYLAYLWPEAKNKQLLIALFVLQLILNIGWNPVFFHFHWVSFGLVVISLLTLLVGFFIFYYWSEVKYKSLLLAPYFIWLVIATSLNGYIYFKN